MDTHKALVFELQFVIMGHGNKVVSFPKPCPKFK